MAIPGNSIQERCAVHLLHRFAHQRQKRIYCCCTNNRMACGVECAGGNFFNLITSPYNSSWCTKGKAYNQFALAFGGTPSSLIPPLPRIAVTLQFHDQISYPKNGIPRLQNILSGKRPSQIFPISQKSCGIVTMEGSCYESFMLLIIDCPFCILAT